MIAVTQIVQAFQIIAVRIRSDFLAHYLHVMQGQTEQ